MGFLSSILSSATVSVMKIVDFLLETLEFGKYIETEGLTRGLKNVFCVCVCMCVYVRVCVRERACVIVRYLHYSA